MGLGLCPLRPVCTANKQESMEILRRISNCQRRSSCVALTNRISHLIFAGRKIRPRTISGRNQKSLGPRLPSDLPDFCLRRPTSRVEHTTDGVTIGGKETVLRKLDFDHPLSVDARTFTSFASLLTSTLDASKTARAPLCYLGIFVRNRDTPRRAQSEDRELVGGGLRGRPGVRGYTSLQGEDHTANDAPLQKTIARRCQAKETSTECPKSLAMLAREQGWFRLNIFRPARALTNIW